VRLVQCKKRKEIRNEIYFSKVEVEVEKYWNAFKKGLAEVLTQANIDSSKIKSIGISAQGETLILVDKEGEPLNNAVVWLDNRAQQESKELAQVFGKEETYKITGQIEIVRHAFLSGSKRSSITRNL